MKSNRIEVLDGYRTLAILSVMFYHFFSRWAPPFHEPSLYPYGDQYNYFGLGYLGVHFFFMISGFVIFFTLEQTPSLSVFWRKRLIRLFPSMLMASFLTFTLFTWADSELLFPDAHQAKNFVTGLTFLSPKLLNKFSGSHFEYLNPSYWSLWPEVQFYILAGILYYVNKANAIRNFILVAFALICINALFSDVVLREQLHINDTLLTFYFVWVANVLNLIIFLPYFCVGIIFYALYKGRAQDWFMKLSGLMMLVYLLCISSMAVGIVYVLMYLLFLAFIYQPAATRLFEMSWLVRVGRSSYFLYLIHESLGVLLIYLLAGYFKPFAFLLVLLIIGILIVFSILYTEKIDFRLTQFLRKILLPNASSK